MKKRNISDVPGVTAPSDSSSSPPSGVTPAADRLQQAISELTKLKLALAARRHPSKHARRQIDALTDGNACLRGELTRLTQHNVADARHFAYHDELTGLPTRRLLLDRLNQAIVQAARQQKQVALLLLDLDGFKDINERFEQAVRDRILRQMAKRLTACIRSTDTACRYEGNEFVIMLPAIGARESATEIAEKIRARLAASHVATDQVMTVRASIGMTVYQGDEQDYTHLTKQAAVAMCLAEAHISSAAFAPFTRH